MVEMFRQYIFDAQFRKPQYFEWRRTVTGQLLMLLMEKAPVFLGLVVILTCQLFLELFLKTVARSGTKRGIRLLPMDIKRISVIYLNKQNIPL